MAITTAPLNRLEADPRGTLNECADSGQALVVELPGDRFVDIQPLDPHEDDSLGSGLPETNAAFQALAAKSKAGPAKPFTGGSGFCPCGGLTRFARDRAPRERACGRSGESSRRLSLAVGRPLSLAHGFGHRIARFGNPDFCGDGPLPGLT